jgi:hypothetical protein
MSRDRREPSPTWKMVEISSGSAFRSKSSWVCPMQRKFQIWNWNFQWMFKSSAFSRKYSESTTILTDFAWSYPLKNRWGFPSFTQRLSCQTWFGIRVRIEVTRIGAVRILPWSFHSRVFSFQRIQRRFSTPRIVLSSEPSDVIGEIPVLSRNFLLSSASTDLISFDVFHRLRPYGWSDSVRCVSQIPFSCWNWPFALIIQNQGHLDFHQIIVISLIYAAESHFKKIRFLDLRIGETVKGRLNRIDPCSLLWIVVYHSVLDDVRRNLTEFLQSGWMRETGNIE